MQLPVSVIVPVKNEEENLRDCLHSVSWADEIFVVDSQSSDRTVEIAREFTDKVVQFHYDGGWPKKKNWALKNLPLQNDWVLILDADERVTSELRDEIAEAIQSGTYDGYYMRWKFVFLGRWMKHCWQHGWMLRLARKGKGEYENLGMQGEGGWDTEVHENIVVEGKTKCLGGYLLHESNKSLSYWIEKQNAFSDWNALRRTRQLEEGMPPLRFLFSPEPLRRRKWLKALFIRLPGTPIMLFIYLYFLRLGMLDGGAGLYFCALRAMHELNIRAKMYELRNVKERPAETSSSS